MSEEYKGRDSGILPQVSSTVTRTRNSGHLGLPSVETTGDRERMYLISAVKYRLHRPHRLECSDLKDFLASGALSRYRQQTVGYRPLSKVPPDYRPLKELRSIQPIQMGFPRCTAIPSTQGARGNCICYFGHK